jgi:hypothetical protein
LHTGLHRQIVKKNSTATEDETPPSHSEQEDSADSDIVPTITENKRLKQLLADARAEIALRIQVWFFSLRRTLSCVLLVPPSCLSAFVFGFVNPKAFQLGLGAPRGSVPGPWPPQLCACSVVVSASNACLRLDPITPSQVHCIIR